MGLPPLEPRELLKMSMSERGGRELVEEEMVADLVEVFEERRVRT